MKLVINKALIQESYLRELAQKTIDTDKLAYFKKQIIEYLNGQAPETTDIKKAVYGIGTIRGWKGGKKYIKGPDKKWRRFYDKEDRGTRIAIKNLIKKVEAINSVDELLNLVMLHRDRFQDEYGHPIPIVQELSRYMKERQEKIAPKPSMEEKKAAFEKEIEYKRTKRSETIMSGKRFKKIVSDLESGSISPLEAREKMKKLVKDEKKQNGGMSVADPNGGSIGIIDGIMNVLQDELNKHEPTKKEEGKKETTPDNDPELSQNHKEFVESRMKDERRKLSAAKSRYKKLMADIQDKRSEGNLKPGEGLRLTMSEASAIRNVKYHEEALANIISEAKSLGIDTGEEKKEPRESEEEKRRNRSEAMKGNDNAKKDGVAEPQTNTEMKEEQTEEKKARKKAKQAPGKRERSSALKDSTWDPKSEDYRYKDTGYIAGSKKEMASTRIKRSAAAGEQVENSSIDWDGVEENERLAETLITKANLFGKVDWDTLKAGGMTGPAGFIINKIYGAIGSKPMDNSPEGRFNYSRGLDSIRSRMEACKTLDEVKQTMVEIDEELEGRFLESRKTPEYLKLAERQKSLTDKLSKLKEKIKDVVYEKSDPFSVAKEFIKKDIGFDAVRLIDPITGEWKGSYWTRGKQKKSLELLRAGQEEYERRAKEYEERMGISRGEMKDEINETERKMRQVASDKDDEILLTNTIAQAWGQLGIKKVLGSAKYPGYNKTMGNHLYEAGKMKDDDWAWSGKRSGPGEEKKDRKNKFELLVADNIVRKGGRDIAVNTTEELKKAFNLRDVQSGNWVLNDPKSAKFHVDNIAMGLADMGDILGIPDNLISLNGRLAMAIGARGSGKALAHYEPVERVINITKMKGGGSLGHEWFHAMDNLIAAAMTGGENWSVWLTESGEEGYQLTDKQKKIKRELEYRKRAVLENPDSEYQKRYYEEAKQKALKAKVPVFESGPDEHIQRVKAAFGNLSKAMMNGSADAMQTIRFNKDDLEESKRYRFYGLDDLKSPEEAARYARSRGWKIHGSRDKAVRCAIARYIADHEGGADKYLNGKGEGSVKVKTGEKTSAFYRGALEIDGDKGGDYWSSLKEMGARAFSAYLNDKMQEKGWENNYLAHATSNQEYGREEGVYPEGEERKAINEAFEELFKAINETGAIRKALDKMPSIFLRRRIKIA
jgi:hypothetical protein